MYLDACHYNFTIKSSYIHRLLIKTSSPFRLLTNNILITFDHPGCSWQCYYYCCRDILIKKKNCRSLCLMIIQIKVTKQLPLLNSWQGVDLSWLFNDSFLFLIKKPSESFLIALWWQYPCQIIRKSDSETSLCPISIGRLKLCKLFQPFWFSVLSSRDQAHRPM